MAIRKIEMRPPGTGDYVDVLYPKTSADIVVSTDGNVQTDINTLKTGKAATNHNHAKSDITDFPTLGTAASKNTGTTSGTIPILDSSGKLSTSVLPALAITDTFVVNSQSDMLALVAETGDVAVRTDLNSSFILRAEPASTLSNWQELLTPNLVTSVAGKTGAVTLSSADVGLDKVTNESKATMFTTPTFTGTPTAPTAAAGTDTTQIATTAFVKSQNYLTAITKAQVEAVLTGTITSHAHSGLMPANHASNHITGGSDIIPDVTSAKSGLAPASGGGTAKYLRADGTWAVPPDSDTIYTHPTGDGNLHVPATSTNNNGKVLKAGPTAGSISWGSLSASDVGAAASNHSHTKSQITDFPTAVSSFANDVGYLTKSLTIGTTQPNDGTLWFKEI